MTDPSPADAGGITKRQREVAGLLADGYTDQAIADRLGISVHTVRGHILQLSYRIPPDPTRTRGRRQRIARWWDEHEHAA
jgi:FixJ family two-component response regulator